jgi:DNA repair protein RadC
MAKEENINELNCEDIYDIIKELLVRENQIGQGVNFVWIVSLSSNNTLLSIEEVSEEISQENGIQPQQVFRIALMKEASSVIMVQYHPDGELKPSENELDITDQMIQAGKIINIQVLDYLLVNEKGYFSFEKSGLMEQLRNSKK